MSTWRNATWRLKVGIANAGAPPLRNQFPFFEEVFNDDQAPVNPPPLIDGYIRDDFLQMAPSITTQAQASTTQDQSMITQAYREVLPRAN